MVASCLVLAGEGFICLTQGDNIGGDLNISQATWISLKYDGNALNIIRKDVYC